MALPRRIPLILLALAGAACGTKKPVLVPTVFPLTPAWSVDLSSPLDAPLATDGTRVFATLRDGTVMALDAAGGSVLWKRTAPAGTTVGAAPGAVVLRQADGLLVRVQPEDGAPLWERQTGIGGSLPPVLDGTEVAVAGEGLALLGLEGPAAARRRQRGAVQRVEQPGDRRRDDDLGISERVHDEHVGLIAQRNADVEDR